MRAKALVSFALCLSAAISAGVSMFAALISMTMRRISAVASARGTAGIADATTTAAAPDRISRRECFMA